MFTDSSAIVTGGGSGIGLACALALHAAGAHVVAVDVKPRPDALPREIEHLHGTVTDPGMAEAAVSLAVERTGTLAALVNAAGVALVGQDGSIADIELEAWRKTLDVNLGGTMLFSRAALRVMRQQRSGALVHIASAVALRGSEDALDAYQVSKAGIVSLSRAIAVQHGPLGIRSNTICPGAILTPMTEQLYVPDPSRRARMEQRTPLRRVGTPEDVAAACMFLLAPESSFVTGVDLVADGGLLAAVP